MKRSSWLAAHRLALALAGFVGAGAHGQALFKWTDPNGTVHYGDRAAAPENSKTVNVPAAPPPRIQERAASAEPGQRAAGAAPALPPGARSATKPVDPALVGPQCKGLIDKVRAVPRGQNWESLSRQFDNACPGIAYECIQFQSSPENNQCTWVKRSGGSILKTMQFP